MANHGGARTGAGRKPGSKTVPALRDFVNDKERKKFIDHMLKAYPESDRIATWVGDHLFGKAPQTLEIEQPEAEPLKLDDKQFNQIVRAAAARGSDNTGGQ